MNKEKVGQHRVDDGRERHLSLPKRADVGATAPQHSTARVKKKRRYAEELDPHDPKTLDEVIAAYENPPRYFSDETEAYFRGTVIPYIVDECKRHGRELPEWVAEFEQEDLVESKKLVKSSDAVIEKKKGSRGRRRPCGAEDEMDKQLERMRESFDAIEKDFEEVNDPVELKELVKALVGIGRNLCSAAKDKKSRERNTARAGRRKAMSRPKYSEGQRIMLKRLSPLCRQTIDMLAEDLAGRDGADVEIDTAITMLAGVPSFSRDGTPSEPVALAITRGLPDDIKMKRDWLSLFGTAAIQMEGRQLW